MSRSGISCPWWALVCSCKSTDSTDDSSIMWNRRLISRINLSLGLGLRLQLRQQSNISSISSMTTRSTCFFDVPSVTSPRNRHYPPAPLTAVVWQADPARVRTPRGPQGWGWALRGLPRARGLGMRRTCLESRGILLHVDCITDPCSVCWYLVDCWNALEVLS